MKRINTKKRCQYRYISSNVQTFYYRSLKRLDNSNTNSILYSSFLTDLHQLLRMDAFKYVESLESILFDMVSKSYPNFQSNEMVNIRYANGLEVLRVRVYDIFLEEYSKAMRKVQIVLKDGRNEKGYILYHLNGANMVAFRLSSKEVATTLESILESILNIKFNTERNAITIKSYVSKCVVSFLDTELKDD